MNVRLTNAQRRAIDEALTPHSLTPLLLRVIQLHLTSYRDRRRVTASDLTRWRREESKLIESARALLKLMRRASPEDYVEGITRAVFPEVPPPVGDSPLCRALAARLGQWQERHQDKRTFSRPFCGDTIEVSWDRNGRPRDYARRDLLRRALGAVNDAGLEDESGERLTRDQRIAFLQAVLGLADSLDRKPTQRGSTRLIREVLAENKTIKNR